MVMKATSKVGSFTWEAQLTVGPNFADSPAASIPFMQVPAGLCAVVDSCIVTLNPGAEVENQTAIIGVALADQGNFAPVIDPAERFANLFWGEEIAATSGLIFATTRQYGVEQHQGTQFYQPGGQNQQQPTGPFSRPGCVLAWDWFQATEAETGSPGFNCSVKGHFIAESHYSSEVVVDPPEHGTLRLTRNQDRWGLFFLGHTENPFGLSFELRGISRPVIEQVSYSGQLAIVSLTGPNTCSLVIQGDDPEEGLLFRPFFAGMHSRMFTNPRELAGPEFEADEPDEPVTVRVIAVGANLQGMWLTGRSLSRPFMTKLPTVTVP